MPRKPNTRQAWGAAETGFAEQWGTGAAFKAQPRVNCRVLRAGQTSAGRVLRDALPRAVDARAERAPHTERTPTAKKSVKNVKSLNNATVSYTVK